MARRNQHQIVIAGGGFAGLAAARALPAKFQVTLIDRTTHFEFLPNIHELVSGVKTPAALRVPRRELLRRFGHRFIQDRIARIDRQTASVITAAGHHYPYDALIVALGAEDPPARVPGLGRHAIGFKSIDECAAIGARLRELAAGEGSFNVVIVGGGFEGVEALGEVLRVHRRNPRLAVTLLDSAERLMPGYPPAVDARLRALCKPYPVTFANGVRVKRLKAGAVELADGRRLAADLTVWTGGLSPPALLTETRLTPDAQTWLPTAATLQHPRDSAMFVVGDVAGSVPNLAKQAYHALDMGAFAATNIQRFLANRPPRPFHPADKPSLVSFGDLSGFLLWEKRAVEGVAFTLMKEAVFQMTLGGLDRPVRPQALWRLGGRLGGTIGRVAWPTITSLDTIRRLPGVRFL
jgi:NADH:quinone reductase (non-electrogenic)